MTELEKVVDLSGGARSQLVETKVTCPFLGPAVAAGVLAVRGNADNPLASVDQVRQLGNTGGGDLGEVLALFAEGNHGRMRGQGNRLDAPLPSALFSLELPGSQGSHPGHSGILQGDPVELGSGRFSQADFTRLEVHARQGLLTRSAAGRFIAENLHRDPKSKVNQAAVAKLLLNDVARTLSTAGATLLKKLFGSKQGTDDTHRELEQQITKLVGEDNLVGSAGEFGLLFAFLANSPGAREIDNEPAVSLEDVRMMFVDKRLPPGWDGWKKTRWDWLVHTTGLIASAARAFARRDAPD